MYSAHTHGGPRIPSAHTWRFARSPIEWAELIWHTCLQSHLRWEQGSIGVTCGQTGEIGSIQDNLCQGGSFRVDLDQSSQWGSIWVNTVQSGLHRFKQGQWMWVDGWLEKMWIRLTQPSWDLGWAWKKCLYKLSLRSVCKAKCSACTSPRRKNRR